MSALIFCMSVSYPEKSRQPGNWFPSLRGQKQRKGAKNDVKLQKSTQNQRKNSPYQQG